MRRGREPERLAQGTERPAQGTERPAQGTERPAQGTERPAQESTARREVPEDELAAWLDAFVRDPGFLERYPCYAAILARLAPVADPSVKRMAVSLFEGRFFLHVNVESFMNEPVFLRGVLLHEVHHVALGHLCHPKFAGADEPELMDLALEMSANEYIEEPLPDPIRWQPYAPLGLRGGQSTLERYELLVSAAREGKLPQRGGEAVDDHRVLRRPSREPGAVEQTRQLLLRAAEEASALAGDGDPADLPGLTLAGKTPGRLIEELTDVLGPRATPLDWKNALRMFVARERAPVHTYARPNRRFPGRLGEVPGRTYAPRAIAKPSVLVAIDTSMSMRREELEEVARQLQAMSEVARVTVAECDTEIARVYAFDGRLGDVGGRGGTDLRPVFAPEFLAARRVSGVIYFTDGAGPTPPAPPPLPVLWILTKPLEFACPWGQRAWLDRKPRRG
ncbi:VWA-like domain-containing protein [Sorangium sp. So ce1078]|uniref:vWA domain-containing protein n=1 Tax=Sorangium sp. So ce1078 TaxID=3133329 RepID=UPI003F600866